VDPKTVVCLFYKQGHCEKGKKCKFSHDLSVERKAVKRDLYSDSRDTEEPENKKEADTMDDWDEKKLRDVVLSKHGNPRTTTEKVCRYFIEAVENQKYGWFWSCPNGGDKCMYRHALPPGYVNPISIYYFCFLGTNDETVSSSKLKNSALPRRLSWINPRSRPSH
jgi:hypothetical protein